MVGWCSMGTFNDPWLGTSWNTLEHRGAEGCWEVLKGVLKHGEQSWRWDVLWRVFPISYEPTLWVRNNPQRLGWNMKQLQMTLMVIWWSFDGHLMVIWWSFDGHLMVIWWSCDYPWSHFSNQIPIESQVVRMWHQGEESVESWSLFKVNKGASGLGGLGRNGILQCLLWVCPKMSGIFPMK